MQLNSRLVTRLRAPWDGVARTISRLLAAQQAGSRTPTHHLVSARGATHQSQLQVQLQGRSKLQTHAQVQLKAYISSTPHPKHHIAKTQETHHVNHVDPANHTRHRTRPKPTEPLPEPYRRHITIEKRFPLVLGGRIPALEVEYTDWTTHPSYYDIETGELNYEGMHEATLRGELPVLYIMPSMSHSAQVSRPPHLRANHSPYAVGWWEDTVGHGHRFGIDTSRFRVICASPLGAPYGTSSPISKIPGDPEGRQYRARFPVITPSDQAQAHHWLLEALGLMHPVDSRGIELPTESGQKKVPPILYGLVGSSMGGMQALAFSARYPGSFQRVTAICCTARTSPSTVALRSVQRDAVRSDPDFKGGDYPPDKGPFHGMAIARKVGTIAYRSRAEFDSRFSWAARDVSEDTPLNGKDAWDPNKPCTLPERVRSLRFEVEDYLEHQAKSFMTRYDANCYLTLSKCMDLMDIGRDYGGYDAGVMRMALSKLDFYKSIVKDSDQVPDLCSIKPEFMLLPVTQDALIPAHEMATLASVLGGKAKAHVHYESLSSVYGHDAFLLEHSLYNSRLAAFFDPSSSHPGGGVDAVRKSVRIAD